MNNNSSKQILLSVIGVAILVVAVVGVSFAFFSYVNNGSANTVETGTIIFKSSGDTLKLTNVFPTSSALAAAANTGDVVTATVSVYGNTTYDNGIDYVVKVQDVKNASTAVGTTITEPIIPRVIVTPAEPTGVDLDAAYEATVTYGNGREVDGKTLTVLADNMVIAKGHIAEGVGSGTDTAPEYVDVLTIKAYYDMTDYHISDNSNSELAGAGLLDEDYETNGGNIISTSDWNALSKADAAYSFKIQVLAVEGGTTRLD